MEKLEFSYKNKTSFIFYEETRNWKIVTYNENNEFSKIVVSEKDGKEFLLDYCLFYRSFYLKENIDTIVLENSLKDVGYVRYMKQNGIVQPLYYLIENFLFVLLVTLKNRMKKVTIRSSDSSKPKTSFYGEDEEGKVVGVSFGVDFNLEYYLPFLLCKYFENCSVDTMEISEDDNQINIDNIYFDYRLLSNTNQRYIQEIIKQRKNESFQDFMASQTGQNILKLIMKNNCYFEEE